MTVVMLDSSVSLCEQHYQWVYKYLASDSLEYALCGSLPKHSAGSKGRHVRSIPQPDEILSEVGNFESFVSKDSNVCNKCYQFCIQLVEEYMRCMRTNTFLRH